MEYRSAKVASKNCDLVDMEKKEKHHRHIINVITEQEHKYQSLLKVWAPRLASHSPLRRRRRRRRLFGS